MKVAITGKGGVGKTTLSSTLARLYADEGRTVLAADVDPDANLGLALGLTEEEVNSITPISKMRQLVEERTGATYTNKFFKLNPQVSDIPDKFARDINGVKLLVMGTVETGGGGCVCPEHVMLKSILSALVFRKDDVVIMDMEAGLEHLGRGTAGCMDRFIVVIEPGARSGMTAIRNLSAPAFRRRICWALSATTPRLSTPTGAAFPLTMSAPGPWRRSGPSRRASTRLEFLKG